MKIMKKILVPVLLMCAASYSLADFYRTNNADTDWFDLANWTTDVEGTTLATAIPGIGNNQQWYFADAAIGTTTIVDSSKGNISMDRLNIKSADLIFDGATVNIGNRINLGNAGGSEATAGNRNKINFTIQNGSYVKTWMAYIANQKYTDVVLTLSEISVVLY